MSSRWVFCFSATCSLTSWPSLGPVTSSRTTVKAGMPAGIFGWSQQVVGPDGWSLFVQDATAANPTNETAAKMAWWAATLRGRGWARIRDLLGMRTSGEVRCTLQHFGGPGVSSGPVERTEQFLPPGVPIRASRYETLADLSEVRGAFLYGWHQDRLLYAYADHDLQRLTSQRQN